MNSSTRRHFLKSASAFAIGIAGLESFAHRAHARSIPGYGPLKKDVAKILDLPAGFGYRLVSTVGERMADGLTLPGAPDGMAAFEGPDGKTIVVRNHELTVGAKNGAFGKDNVDLKKIDAAKLYDAGAKGVPMFGGTTTFVYDTRSQRMERQFLSLAGTIRNCAGGPTPWNSWITCEEGVNTAGGDFAKSHGFNFDVPATADPKLAEPIPLVDMGRFNHEAVAVDPKSGIVYQTEDRSDGLIYRFIPKVPGQLARGGRLQALGIARRHSFDTRNWIERSMRPTEARDVQWIDLKDVATDSDLLRFRGFNDGAARFARGEGMWYSEGSIYFACTNGGRTRNGQIFRYQISPDEGTPGESKNRGKLELFIEPNDPSLVDMCDNITVAPWGDLIICEDGSGEQNLSGVTPEGGIYRLGHNAGNNSEFAGACFSPDGTTLFVNIQKTGQTLAITGDWKSRRG
ncbi:MAG: phosphatase [Verrucomicrobiales bacterium]|nr:phosphatase [Verrucomicrobiales bacterium]